MNDIQKLILAGGFLLLTGGIVLLSYDRFRKDGPIRVLQVERNENEVEKADRQLKEADEYLRQNSQESARKALDLFNSVLSRGLNERVDQYARYGLAMALEKIDDPATALEHLRWLKQNQSKIESQDLKDRVDYSLGRLLLVINHEMEGKALLESLLARTNDQRMKSRIHTAYGHYFLGRGDRQRAQENFNIALKYFPENLQAEMGRANAVSGQRRSMYYEYYDEYLTGNANLNPAQRNRDARNLQETTYDAGIRAYRSGRYQDAIDLFGRVLKDGRDNTESETARYMTAESLQQLGRTRQAYETYEQILGNVTTTRDQAALIRMGILLYQQGKLQEALTRFYRASENYPNGEHTAKALEWKRETETQIREHEQLRNYDDTKREEKLDRPQSYDDDSRPRQTEREASLNSYNTSVQLSQENSSEDMVIEVDGKKMKLAASPQVR